MMPVRLLALCELWRVVTVATGAGAAHAVKLAGSL